MTVRYLLNYQAARTLSLGPMRLFAMNVDLIVLDVTGLYLGSRI
jgi:hypothetical protein